MNKEQQSTTSSPAGREAMIHLRGRSYTVAEAGALAAAEQQRMNFQAAVDVFDLIIAQAPTYAEAHNNRGVALQEMRRHAEALASFNHAIALKPDYANAHNNRAAALRQLKRYDEALASYDKTIGLKPDHANAHNNRGATLQNLRRHEEALASFNQAIALKPDYASAYHNRGAALQELNRLAEALASYDKALAIKPDYAESYNNRALVLQAMKRHAEALASCDKAIAVKPAYANVYNTRGLSLQAMQRNIEALASYDKAIALKPDHAEAHNNRGVVLQELKRHAEALASYDRAIALKPDNAKFHNHRGTTLQAMKRYEEALVSYDKAITIDPDNAEFHNNRGVTLKPMKRFDEALASYDKAIALKPNDADCYNNRGHILINKGRMQEAEAMFHKALDLKPDFADPLCALTGIRKYQNADNTEVKAIQSLLNNPAIAPDDKEYLYFSLGKIYDDCGLYDEAFESYRLGNQLRNATVSYNANEVVETTKSIMDVFSKDFLAQPFAFASGSQTPLVVVGMPRSGTTLMASVLSNHRSIATAGELPTITDFALLLPAMTEAGIPYPNAAKHITPAIAKQLITEYEKRLRRDFGSDIPHVVDKHPLNFWHLGLVSMLFPKARIIHCKRHPLDTGLSNYFQRFGLQYNYSFDLRNIGHFYGEYARLMEHWRNVLSQQMIEINYQDMILDTEQTARKILDFIGLEWDERCLTPHTNPAAIETASQWQVRQPIYNKSLDRWRHYEKHLAPMKEMLALAGQLPA